MKKLCAMIACVLCVILAAPCACAVEYVESGTAAPKAYEMPYTIEVDITHQLVFVRRTEDASTVRVMICSTGKRDGWTPIGTFYMTNKSYSTERTAWHNFNGDYARYPARITGPYLFHSILYDAKRVSSLQVDTWKALGSPASHGCIRLTPLDAQWVAYHCAKGTRVTIRRASKNAERKLLRTQLKNLLPKPASNGTVGDYEPTLTPTPKPAPPTLRLGSNGSRVTRLQTRLQTLGFYPGKIATKYDSATASAVKAYQIAVGEAPSGETTPALFDAIMANDTPTGTRVTLRKGSNSPAVKALQRRLKQLGLLTASVNGKYGTGTVKAVQAFQKNNNLKQTGVATPAVQNLIFYGQPTEPTASPTPAPTATPTPMV